MFLCRVRFESMWHLVKIFFPKCTNETLRFHVVFDLFLLISQFSESVNDQTLDDGQNDNDDKEEKRDIKGESEKIVVNIFYSYNQYWSFRCKNETDR